ncbi:MAG: ABC transporter ATP-binding protein [Ruminococcus sp.]|nr:ABC transporter ATP-binding protein [Ruminococcus sp.]
MEKILEVNDLCKTYIVNKRQINVLRNINFHVDKGEMIAVMGPSGSGKSSLLYGVSGMDKPTAGRVSFCGRQIETLKDDELSDIRLDDMGFIFQQMYMMKNLSVLDNIILPAVKSTKNKLSRKELSQKGTALMKKLGIESIAGNDINEVSGGQLQRACICRSLINEPEIIFADEPTGALDRTSSDEVMDELERLNGEGTTIMLVTHDARVAARCSRVLFIVDGNIKDEYNKDNKATLRDNERNLNNWLLEMGF